MRAEAGLIGVYLPVFGSYIVTRRLVLLSGNSTAEDGSILFAEIGVVRLVAVAASQTRPLRSNIELWFVGLAVPDVFLAPVGEAADLDRARVAGAERERHVGVVGRTKFVATFFTGSRIGMSLQACSHCP